MKRIAIDMDGVLADWDKAHYAEGKSKYEPFFYLNLQPIKGAVEAYKALYDMGFDLHILSSPPMSNPDGWKEKALWCKGWLYKGAYKKITLTHSKHLFKADYLIDDSVGLGLNGIDEFEGELIHFGSDKFPDWGSVVKYIKKKEGILSVNIKEPQVVHGNKLNFRFIDGDIGI